MPGTASLGFADRMTCNMRIKAAWKSADSPMSPAELARKAASIEAQIYSVASSIEEYRRLCEKACANAALEPGQHDGPPPKAQHLPPNDNPVESIGPYKAQFHASGIFSAVYRAISGTSDGGFIAIKVTKPEQMSVPHDSEREARLLKRLTNAPHVVPLLSSQWIAGGVFLLAFPFLPCNLGKLLDDGRLTAQQRRSHLYGLFKALEYIHSQGIIHRDVKPSNVISRGADGPAYLADFGIAWYAGDPASEPANGKITDVGTTCYRPPELLFGHKSYTAKLDMWAAGCTVAECLRGGKSLFDAGDLGSELALLRSIFTTLGTPTDTDWPEANEMPDWGKMQFTEYPKQDWEDVLPGVEPTGSTLVAQLVCYQSTERLSASEALRSEYFQEIR